MAVGRGRHAPERRRRAVMEQYRFFGALRLFLALCVVLQHFGSQIAPEGLRSAVAPFAPGNCAVMAFFVLSGFIIAEASDLYYRERPGAFLANRCLRVVPQFVVAMTATVAVYLTIDALDDDAVPDEMLAWSSIAANYGSIFPGLPFPGAQGGPGQSFILAVWALRAEFLFYLAFALCIALATWLGGERARILVGGAIVVAALFGLSRMGYAPRIFGFGPYFVFGVAVFYAFSGRRAAFWIAAAALAGMAVHFSDYDSGSPIAAAYDRPAQFAILTTMLVAMLGLARLRLERWRKIDLRLGDLSYSVYLNHAAVQAIAQYAVPSPTLATFAIAVVGALLYAVLMQSLTEPPLRYFRDRIRGRATAGRATRLPSEPSGGPALS